MCKLWGSKYTFLRAFTAESCSEKTATTDLTALHRMLWCTMAVAGGGPPHLDWPRPQVTGGCLIHLVLLNTGPLIVDEYNARVQIPSGMSLHTTFGRFASHIERGATLRLNGLVGSVRC